MRKRKEAPTEATVEAIQSPDNGVAAPHFDGEPCRSIVPPVADIVNRFIGTGEENAVPLSVLVRQSDTAKGHRAAAAWRYRDMHERVWLFPSRNAGGGYRISAAGRTACAFRLFYPQVCATAREADAR